MLGSDHMDIVRRKVEFGSSIPLVYLDLQILGMVELSEQTIDIGGSMTAAIKMRK